jgi:CheY-like chemotaxis protein
MMISAGKIFVLEDIDRWRNLLCRLLAKEGYYVDSANSLAEARKCLKENFYHLAILDIQLDKSNPKNEEGMKLLEELHQSGSLKALKIIMFSGIAEKTHFREAFAKYGVLDFYDKEPFSNKKFVEKIHKVFLSQIKVNPSLEISWQSTTAEQAVLNLRLFKGKIQIKTNSDIKNLIAEELDDLLRRLFYSANSIIVKPLKPGMSGTSVLLVRAFNSIGGTASLIVKFGDSEVIKKEEENFNNYVRLYGGARHTSILDVAYTPRLGGIMYQLLGASDEDLESFSDYYAKSTDSEIIYALDDLFYGTCHSWYKSPGVEQAVNITRHYLNKMPITKENLESRFGNLKVKRDSDKLIIFNDLDKNRKFINPLSILSKGDISFPTYKCIVHGDLNASNILVDKDHHSWLIDFGATGIGHILEDFIELDSIIRFQLLTANDASLEERLYLEESFLSIKNFNQAELSDILFETNNQKLYKAFRTILHLYTLINNFSPNKKANIDEYYLTLLFYSLNTIRFQNLELVQRQHALLCASLLSEKLNERGVYG